MNEQPYKWMKSEVDKIIIDVKVIPNSSKNSISIEDEFLKIKLTAPPVDNKANIALIEYMAKMLKIPKNSVTIRSGINSKNKRLNMPKSVISNLLKFMKEN